MLPIDLGQLVLLAVACAGWYIIIDTLQRAHANRQTDAVVRPMQDAVDVYAQRMSGGLAATMQSDLQKRLGPDYGVAVRVRYSKE